MATCPIPSSHGSYHIDDLAQGCGNSSAVALELPQSCPKSSISCIILTHLSPDDGLPDQQRYQFIQDQCKEPDKGSSVRQAQFTDWFLQLPLKVDLPDPWWDFVFLSIMAETQELVQMLVLRDGRKYGHVINTLWPRGTILRLKFLSKLVQVMACHQLDTKPLPLSELMPLLLLIGHLRTSLS